MQIVTNLKTLVLNIVIFISLLGCNKNTEVEDAENKVNVKYFKTWQKPYTIKQITYTPRQNYAYFDEVGYASVYNTKECRRYKEFYNALGDIFDDRVCSAAHRTLPIPSIVLVSTLVPTITKYDKTYKIRHAMVVVTDRGPFADTPRRIIDLSKNCAKILGAPLNSLFPVRVTMLPEASANYANYYREMQNYNKKNNINSHRVKRVLDFLKKNNFRCMPYKVFEKQWLA